MLVPFGVSGGELKKLPQTALPSHFYPSDHLALKAEFLFLEGLEASTTSPTSEPTKAASSVWNEESD